MKGLRISERMCGHIEFDNSVEHIEKGERYPFDIDIHAYSPKLFSYPVKLYFKGTAHFPGIPLDPNLPVKMQNPPVEGTMEISIHGVKYDFSLTLPSAGKLDIKGEKSYAWSSFSWKKLRYSLITLPLIVKKDGKRVGESLLTYLPPLWQFIFGVRLASPKHAHNPNLEFAQILAPLINVIFPDYREIGDEALISRSIEQQLNATPYFYLKLLELSYFILKIFTLFRFGKFLKSLNDSEYKKIDHIMNTNPFFRLILMPLALTIVYPLFGQKEYLKKKGQNIVEPPKVSESEPWMKLNFTPKATKANEKREVIEVDVVVVGSGAGGAALSYELSRKGYAVAIIEEGQYFKRADLTGLTNDMIHTLYQNKGMNFSISNSALWIPTGKCVGGTTFINSGTCIRTPQNVLDRWEQTLGLKNLNLEKYFPEVEAMLGNKEVPLNLVGGIYNVLKRGTAGTDLKVEPLRRAEKGCDGQGYCAVGCPTNAKQSTAVSYIPEAMKSGAHLFSLHKLEKILFEGKKAVGVVAKLDNFDETFHQEFRAKKVVIAAGTFGSFEILHNAGVGENLDHLGRHLTIHPAVTVGGLFPYESRETFFVPQSLGIFGIENKGYVLEGYTLPVDTIAAMGLSGSDLALVMKNIKNFTNFSSMIKDPAEGRLLNTPFGVVPSYFVNEKLNQTIKESAANIAEIFLKAQATNVFLPIQGWQNISSFGQYEKFKKAKVKSYHYALSAHHPLGSCRMGDSNKNSVVSPECRVWGYENLFVTDGSVIQGPLGVNPQVTIMSNALRVANIIATEL